MSLDFSFKGINAIDKNFITQDIIISPLARQEERVIDIPKIPGLIQVSKKFTKREIKIRGILYGSSSSDLVEKIKEFSAFLFSEEDEQLISNEQLTKHYLAQHMKYIELEREPTHVTFELEFNCNDPFGYTTIPIPGNQNCTTKPTTIPINNEGNYKACPIWVITFTQAQTYIKLYNDDNSEIFNITRAFAIGDKLKIDTKSKIVYYDSGAGYVEDWLGVGLGGENRADFVKLKVGNKNYYISTTDATLNCNVSWSFHKTWL